MSANAGLLVSRNEKGWRIGLANMLAKELRAWWRTRQWWLHCLFGLLLLNGTIALNLRGHGRVDNVGLSFLITSGLFVPVAAVNLGQDSILGERHSGTAAWVLSKPLRRPGFVLAKLLAHGLGMLVAWVVLPGVCAYLQLSAAAPGFLPGMGWVRAMGLAYLNLFFYLTLAVMLATWFNGRGPILGISLLIAWFGPMQFIAEPLLRYVPWLENILPWRLMVDFGRDGPLAGYLAVGRPLPTVVPIVATALWCVLFVGVAIWKFGREEF